MLADKDRIFTNLYGQHDPFLEAARASGGLGWDGGRSSRGGGTRSSMR